MLLFFFFFFWGSCGFFCGFFLFPFVVVLVIFVFYFPPFHDISCRDHNIILQHYVLFQHAVPFHVSAADGDAAHYALQKLQQDLLCEL